MSLVKIRDFPLGEHYKTKLNEPSEAALALPFYPLLPKDPIKLLKWRIYVRERCMKDLEFRDAIWQMCSQDVVFFAVTFCWIHETRGGNPISFPFTPWVDQVDVMTWVANNIGLRDILVDKSRGIGMSWVFMIITIWKWLFVDTADIALVSKDETSLDMRDRPTTLMGKLDFLFKRLPAWMQMDSDGSSILSRTSSSTHKFSNLHNGTAVIGYVPEDEKLRSGRYLFVLFDEFAFLKRTDMQALMPASHGTTFCRIWLSTYNGSNDFYHMANNFTTTKLRISTFWWDNPDRFHGAYKSENGRIKFLDPDCKYPDPKRYNYVADDRLRSFWFDKELNREGVDLARMLQELNGVAALDTRKLFRPEVLKASKQYLKPPIRKGWIGEDGVWRDDSKGPFKLWAYPGEASGPYMIGADPSNGVPGGDFAGLQVIDIRTGEHVMSAALQEVNPEKLAKYAYGVSKFFAGVRGDAWAKICYESTGLGPTFVNELKRLQFHGIWRADPTKKITGWQNRDRGESILFELARAILEGELFVHCEKTESEFPFFEYVDKNGKVVLEYLGKEGHGDNAMALAIAWHACRKRRKNYLEAKEKEVELLQGVQHEPALKRANRLKSLWSNQYRRTSVL